MSIIGHSQLSDDIHSNRENTVSLEAKIEALTDALKENTELLKALTAKAKANVSAEPKASTKTDDGDEKPASRSTSRGRGRPKKDKAPTAAEVKKATEAFLDVEDEDEYAERRKIIKKLIAKYGAAKMTEIEEGKRASALSDMEAYCNGDEIDFGEDDDI